MAERKDVTMGGGVAGGVVHALITHKEIDYLIAALLAFMIALYFLHGKRRRRHHRKGIVSSVVFIAVMAYYSDGLTLIIFPAYITLRVAGVWWRRRKKRPDAAGHIPLDQRQSRYIHNYVKVAASVAAMGRCRICGKPVGNDPQFDHIKPWSKGGLATVDNIQLLCGPCNRRKSDHS